MTSASREHTLRRKGSNGNMKGRGRTGFSRKKSGSMSPSKGGHYVHNQRPMEIDDERAKALQESLTNLLNDTGGGGLLGKRRSEESDGGGGNGNDHARDERAGKRPRPTRPKVRSVFLLSRAPRLRYTYSPVRGLSRHRRQSLISKHRTRSLTSNLVATRLSRRSSPKFRRRACASLMRILLREMRKGNSCDCSREKTETLSLKLSVLRRLAALQLLLGGIAGKVPGRIDEPEIWCTLDESI